MQAIRTRSFDRPEVMKLEEFFMSILRVSGRLLLLP